MDTIEIRGARTHNLKNLDLTIPRDRLIVITGISGSGKSSLAFDTLYAEGQRRYVESLSAYARQFLSVMEKPDLDHIEGLSPAISIEQKATSHNPRSTVGTVTEIYDYLRLLFARIGQPYCPTHKQPLNAQTISQMVDSILHLGHEKKIMVCAPVVQNQKGEHIALIQQLRQQGYIRARIDGKLTELDTIPKLAKQKFHTIEVVVDRLIIRPDIQSRLAESLEHACNLTEGLVKIYEIDKENHWVFSMNYACTECGYSMPKLEPRLFSFNNPMGACPSCKGLGTDQFFDEKKIIRDPNLSIAQGAIHGWDPRRFFYYSMLQSVANHYGFSLEKPYKSIPKKYQQILLYGSDEEKITFQYANNKGSFYESSHTFEGILPNMDRRYHETESSLVREELTKYISTRICEECQGTRLIAAARQVYVESHNLPEISDWTIERTLTFFKSLSLTGARAKIASKINHEIIERLQFLMNVGLNYLSLSRSAETLSGGEAQRIRLASQIGSGLVGVMYILDEPSIGLHQRDNDRLLSTLYRLRDLGNTVIVVEHDEEAIRSADHIIDIGPGAGIHGGRIVAEGPLNDILKNARSITGQYLNGIRSIAMPRTRKPYIEENQLTLKKVHCHNLKNVTINIPCGLFTCVTGVSGSGKSSLINDTLYPLAKSYFYDDEPINRDINAELEGIEQITNVINITQSPIGRTPRSNPATYTSLFNHIRDLFAQTQEARSRGYQPGRFSFNVKGGRCEACSGEGLIKVEMHFLPDIYVHCDACKGKRYNRETLEVLYKGKNIHEVLEMTVEEANEFFSAVPSITKICQTMIDVGLSYIHLGQSATTLSGGEAQRIKLSKELSKHSTGNTLYILDEPTTGLHFQDIDQLLQVIHRLRDKGNTIIVIEHNLDVIKTADWIIDLGPEGGDGGGQVIAVGTPEEICKVPQSYTGQYLKAHIKNQNKKLKSKETASA